MASDGRAQEAVIQALSLGGQTLMGQTVMVKSSEAEKNLAWEAAQVWLLLQGGTWFRACWAEHPRLAGAIEQQSLVADFSFDFQPTLTKGRQQYATLFHFICGPLFDQVFIIALFQ